MTEATFSALTLATVVIALSMTSFNKLRFAFDMHENTHTVTNLGKWLMRMFTSMGLVLAVMATVFFLTLLNEWGVMEYGFRLRQTLRVALIIGSVSCCISTIMVRQALIPLLKDTEQERRERSWLFQSPTTSSDLPEERPKDGSKP